MALANIRNRITNHREGSRMNSESIAATPAQERIDAVEVQERLSWPSAPAPAYCDTWLMVNAGALNFKASENHQVAAMANIGHQLLQEIDAYRPAFKWTKSPVEIIGALVEETAPAGAAMQDSVNDAERDVIAERRRQQSIEGWTAKHDDKYTFRELIRAAVCYLLCGHSTPAPVTWPWAAKWWKPTTRRQNCVKAAALLIAEIERIDRAGNDGEIGAL